MPSILRIQPHVFMEVPRRLDSFDRVTPAACRAIAQAANDLGVERATYYDAYDHMRRLRWRWPATYAACDEAANRIKVEVQS